MRASSATRRFKSRAAKFMVRIPIIASIDWTNNAHFAIIGACKPNTKEHPMQENRSSHIHNPASIAKPAGYSHVAEVLGGKIVYIAGQVALDQHGQLAGTDFAAQVQQVFVNLNEALKSA